MRIRLLFSGLVATVLPVFCGCATWGQARAVADVLIDDTEVYPESLTATVAGDLIVGSIKGNLYRARRGEARATAWIRPDAVNGLQSVFGVLAHEPSRTLWVCSVPNPFKPPVAGGVAELVAFDLGSGQLKARYVFPPPRSVCNDMTVARDGSVYAADTQNGRILKGEQAARAAADKSNGAARHREERGDSRSSSNSDTRAAVEQSLCAATSGALGLRR